MRGKFYVSNPFNSPTKATATATTPNTEIEESDVLATADLFLEQLKELENLCFTVEERVQRKRRALKELEYLILGSDPAGGSPRSPVCPANTPISARLRLVSPRLRGLFDLRGPGQANLDAIQSCLDYSPGTEGNLSMREDAGHSEAWADDDDDEGLTSPFDDKYALPQSPEEAEKQLPAIPKEESSEVLQSKIPRKVHIQREVLGSRRIAGRPPGVAVLSNSNERRPINATNDVPDLTTKGMMRRGSWKRSIIKNVKAKGEVKAENEMVKENGRRKEKRKGLRSIYWVGHAV